MELVLIRHGQGEHTVDIPNSLQIKDPSLTAKGVKQAKLLRNTFPLTNKDIIYISPTRRTLQTAFIWSEHVACTKIVTPFVSPRMFPVLPSKSSLPCDYIIELEIIKSDYPTFEIDRNAPLELWKNGINVMDERKFKKIAEEFIANSKLLQKEVIYIVSHDGTITSYRQLISGKILTRRDFPRETGWFQINC
ncbi:histidine phosphatase family protein [Sporosarcina sp. Marseille-Q4063]|uniref:phosphoglycerate mutase family protein n=1 Tax=Sporosarcina sp. Marseille-Q4063 TaxID=2810514 RepID=UPI001BAEDE85|nr:histidine phosphatase family protein [Sporosarcina sp. Marseille-Q4063]QUW23567.1 histidine phosphatase family protein [Sporosarcina sp. Marseille-Q4063]